MSDAEKKARLAEALRQNLRKRKAQAREQEGAEASEDAPQRDCTQSAARGPGHRPLSMIACGPIRYIAIVTAPAKNHIIDWRAFLPTIAVRPHSTAGRRFEHPRMIEH
jgi:hypothetical protein